MGGAHGHGGGHGHDAHGHAHDAHAATADAHAHGGEIPAAPATRSITPAPEDFVNLPGAASMVYPLVWLVAGAVLVVALLAGGWSLHHQDAHGEHGAPAAGH